MTGRFWFGRGFCLAVVLFAGNAMAQVRPAVDSTFALADSDRSGSSAEPSPHVLANDDSDARRRGACSALAQAPWPRSAADRRALLQQLDSARNACKDNPAFLALLGGTWLEEGEPGLALLWLERALLLDGNLPGAQADHALALLALGDGTARDELVAAWRARTDVPPLLLHRLQSASVGPRTDAERAATSGRNWAQIRELSIFYGYESNLNRSPRLSELTLTPPDGPITLPVDQPLAPRPGSALLAEASWQIAATPWPDTVVQGGVQGAGRAAANRPDTDTNWQNLQLAAGAAHLVAAWRLSAQLSAGWVSGALQDPYRLTRWAFGAERDGLGCAHRLQIEQEDRRTPTSGLNDGRGTAAGWNTLCPIAWRRGWRAGLALRAGVDEPHDPDRPGGRQRIGTLALRLLGDAGREWRFDATLRVSRGLDAKGYNPLLEDNRRRGHVSTHLNLEMTHRAPELSGPQRAAEYVLQFQGVQQSANLALFTYTSAALYAGIRLKW